MNNCFIDSVVDSEEGRLFLICMFDPSKFLEYELKYVDTEELKGIYESKQYTMDFILDGEYLRWKGVTLNVGDESLKGQYVKIECVNNNIYSTLVELVKAKASYVHDSVVESLEDSERFPGLGVSRLTNLRVSKSTMGIYMSLMWEDGWASETLVGINSEGLFLKPFHVLVPTDQIEERTGLKKVSSLNLNDEVYDLFKVSEDTPVYASFRPNFHLTSPYINYKVIEAECKKEVVEQLTGLIKILEERIYGPQEQLVKESFYKQPNTDGVFFETLRKKVSKADQHRLLGRCSTEFAPAVSSGELSLVGLRAKLTKENKSAVEIKGAIDLTVFLVKTAGKDFLSILEAAQATKRSIQVQQAHLDLELFAMRSIIYLSGHPFPDYLTKTIFKGGYHSCDSVGIKRGAMLLHEFI
jgi:hypothetical protein